jgi:hypothetical protein
MLDEAIRYAARHPLTSIPQFNLDLLGALSWLIKLSHWGEAKVSSGPSAFLLSRTAINHDKLSATSTQPPLAPL